MARANNSVEVQYGFGQMGSIHCAGTEVVTCAVANRVFVAIQFLEDTKFNAGADGLVSADTQLFPDSTTTSTAIDADAGDVTDNEVFPKGVIIYGRWTRFQLAEGRVIAYIGM